MLSSAPEDSAGRSRTGLGVALVAVTVLLLVLSLRNARYPQQQWLQHSPSVVAMLLLTLSVCRRWQSVASVACCVVFLWFHILGARYIYSYVPYDRWSESVLGWRLSDKFGWDRNHYDRLVHFSFGALSVLPVMEAGRRCSISRRWQLALLALLFVGAVSAAYEVLEWLLAVVMSPANAEAYNGQQGDIWDAQKDMTLAFAGTILVLPSAVLRRTANR